MGPVYALGALPNGASPDQVQVIDEVARDALAAYTRREIGPAQAFQFQKAWTGTTGILGWESLAASLKSQPGLRSKVAYVLGERYLRVLVRPQEAREILRTAVTDAPPNSTLRQLAAQTLEAAKHK